MSYYCADFEIGCHDTDENNNVRPTELVRLLQETANRQMRDRRPSYVEFFNMGKAFVITKLSVEIFDQLHQFDKVQVRTWTCPGKAATFPRSYQIWRGEELVVRAHSEWAVPDRFTGKLSKTTEIDISGYERDEALTLPLLKRIRFPKDMVFHPVDKHQVRYSECDMNRHMNNTNYFNLLWDRIPEVMRKQVTSLNVRFIHEAPLGGNIQITMAEAEQKMAGDPRAEEVWACKTAVSEGTNVECLIGVKEIDD